MKPMPVRKFKQLVHSNGHTLKPTSKEWGIFNADGQLILSVAVSHGKNKPKEVKPVYLRQYACLVEQLANEVTSP